jgi:hypothetical protein
MYSILFYTRPIFKSQHRATCLKWIVRKVKKEEIQHPENYKITKEK